jgi:YesN/AraC family two-component response regulator
MVLKLMFLTIQKEALEKCRPDAYDIMLLDIRMPVMSGFDLYRELHKMDGKEKICFMTAFEIYPR